MKTLLQRLGLVRREEPKAEPVCNLSLKNAYFNRVALDYSIFERVHGRPMTPEESRKSNQAIQKEMGVKVTYHPEHFAFS